MFVRFFFCKQKTAYEMRISDWSSDVCSSDLLAPGGYSPGRIGGIAQQISCPDRTRYVGAEDRPFAVEDRAARLAHRSALNFAGRTGTADWKAFLERGLKPRWSRPRRDGLRHDGENGYSHRPELVHLISPRFSVRRTGPGPVDLTDRKSTRLNSRH